MLILMRRKDETVNLILKDNDERNEDIKVELTVKEIFHSKEGSQVSLKFTVPPAGLAFLSTVDKPFEIDLSGSGDEKVYLKVMVTKIIGAHVTLGFEAPRCINIVRQELLEPALV